MGALNSHDILLFLSNKYNGNWDAIYGAIRSKEKLNSEEVVDIAEKYKGRCRTVAITDPDYPNSLKKMDKPPFILFYYGDLDCIQQEDRCVAYIGSRDASPYGKKMAKAICGRLAKDDYVVVSGMAKGIDSVAGIATLENGGKTVAVLGSGINICYPCENEELYKNIKEFGLVISEYPFDVKPSKETFPLRNRIIAALSKMVIVGEANKHSGTLITINYALEFGKDVACIPFRADEDSACNLLIRDGASIVNSYEDVQNLLE